MAEKQHDDDGRAAVTEAEAGCMPCGGSGRVVSKLGGTDTTLTCPWCEGTGVRTRGLDAQAHWQTGVQEDVQS